MRFSALIAVLALATALNTVYATSGDEDTIAYCTEQAERDGIENMDEKNQYINDCVESYAIPSADSPQPGE